MARISVGALRLILMVAALLSLLGVRGVRAQNLDYQRIDRATVRVLALGSIDVVKVELDSKRYSLAAPIAGHGSGVIVSEDGVLVTADHVLSSARAVAVLVPGVLGPKYAVVLHRDPVRDVAILRIAGRFESFATLAPPDQSLRVRQQVYAIGYPLDSTRSDPQSTQGVVSGLLPDGQIQLGIALNPGNSGGPMIDENSTIQGIVVARSNVAAGAIGLGVAVPVNSFRAAIERSVSTPLSTEQAARLNHPGQQQLADLVSLIAQYGPDVIRASLTAPARDNREIESKLETAAASAASSVDAKLVAAAFYWNRHVVLKAKDDPAWQVSHARAVELVQQSLKLEPNLRESSAFVRLLAAESPADAPEEQSQEHETLGKRRGFYASVDVSGLLMGGTRTVSNATKSSNVKYSGYGIRGRLAAGAFVSRRLRLGGVFAYTSGVTHLPCDDPSSAVAGACSSAAENGELSASLQQMALMGDLGIRLVERLSLGVQLGYTDARGKLVIGESTAKGLGGSLEVEYAALQLSSEFHLGVSGYVQSSRLHDAAQLIVQQIGIGLRAMYF